jgi:hypothetical protein
VNPEATIDRVAWYETGAGNPGLGDPERQGRCNTMHGTRQERYKEQEIPSSAVGYRDEASASRSASDRTPHNAQSCIEMRAKSDALSAECLSGKNALSAC